MLIYVWNLSLKASEVFLRQTFEGFGQVSFAIISSIDFKTRDDGQIRRFGFVEMPKQNEAQAAIKNLNMKVLLGLQMIVHG